MGLCLYELIYNYTSNISYTYVFIYKAIQGLEVGAHVEGPGRFGKYTCKPYKSPCYLDE